MQGSSNAMTDTTVTVRVSRDLKNRLEVLSLATRRSKSFLANEALTFFVETEEQHVAGIREAMIEARSGLVVSHEVVMDELDAIIDAAALARQGS